MATLVRQRQEPEEHSIDLSSTVPTPFPVDLLEQVSENPFLSADEQIQEDVAQVPTSEENEELSTIVSPFPAEKAYSHCLFQNEIIPSIATLQKSCIMTLNTLLSGSEQWKTIVPDRRHSMPSTPTPSSSVPENPATYALETLVMNLRKQQDTGDEMTEFHPPTTEAALAHELQERVRKVSPSLSPEDATLANSLTTILTYFSRLSSIQASYPPTNGATTSTHTPRNDAPPPVDMYDALTRQLNELQLERLTNGVSSSSSTELSILWSQIDRELENIVSMCKQRAELVPRFFPENQPPQYDYDYDELYDFESPPEYDGGSKVRDSKSEPETAAPSRITDEKMRQDLESITMAIDRLYLVAPQLHNQRVELNSSKLAQLERARQEGTKMNSRKGKERDRKELETMIEMIGKASERTLKDQSVVLEGGMESMLEKAKMKDRAKRDAFVENLIKHSDAGRMHEQDAVFQPRVKDPSAKLTFPEFIREHIPPDSELLRDPSVMLTLPEFVAQHSSPDDLPNAPDFLAQPPPSSGGKLKKKASGLMGSTRRSRSLSAPPLAWLRSMSNSSSSSAVSSSSSSRQKPTSSNTSLSSTSSLSQRDRPAFDIAYVAENHENLHHVLVFFTANRPATSSDLRAEILPPFPEHISTGGDHLVIRCGANVSLPLILPARTTPGRKDISAQKGHFEIKLATLPGAASEDLSGESGGTSSPLLDATKLGNANPSSFICASCSLPLVQPSPGRRRSGSGSGSETARTNKSGADGEGLVYRDLPSEHWEELVEAWMCHSDQKLHDQAIKHGKAGFWPKKGQAFVGGSYILFEESVVVTHNLLAPQEDKVRSPSFMRISASPPFLLSFLIPFLLHSGAALDSVVRANKKAGIGYPPTAACPPS